MNVFISLIPSCPIIIIRSELKDNQNSIQKIKIQFPFKFQLFCQKATLKKRIYICREGKHVKMWTFRRLLHELARMFKVNITISQNLFCLHPVDIFVYCDFIIILAKCITSVVPHMKPLILFLPHSLF